MAPIGPDCLSTAGGGGPGDPCCPATNVLLTDVETNTQRVSDAVHDEDTPHVSGDPGIPAWAVRNDDGVTTFTDANGDYSPIAVDANGRLLLPAGAATEATLAAAAASLASILTSVDQLEGFTDGLEGFTDGLEGLLTSLNGFVDGLEGFTDGIEGSLTILVSATHAEDAPHVSGDVGAFALAVRNDADAVVTDTDGDYSQISVDSAGRVKVTGTVTASPPAAVQRLVDGERQLGAGTIVIPDGVLSFAVSVQVVGSGVTIDGPDFAAPVDLYAGQSIGHAADESNTLNGPITVTTTALSDVNAIWVKP